MANKVIDEKKKHLKSVESRLISITPALIIMCLIKAMNFCPVLHKLNRVKLFHQETDYFSPSCNVGFYFCSLGSSPWAKLLALRWSSCSLPTMSDSASFPAAAKTPACLMPPPRALRARTACCTKSLGPPSMVPTGAPKPCQYGRSMADQKKEGYASAHIWGGERCHNYFA